MTDCEPEAMLLRVFPEPSIKVQPEAREKVAVPSAIELSINSVPVKVVPGTGPERSIDVATPLLSVSIRQS